MGSVWWDLDGTNEPSGEFKAPLVVHVHFSEDQHAAVAPRPLYMRNTMKTSFFLPAGATLCPSSIIVLFGSWEVCCDMNALDKQSDCMVNHRLYAQLSKVAGEEKNISFPEGTLVSPVTLWKAKFKEFCLLSRLGSYSPNHFVKVWIPGFFPGWQPVTFRLFATNSGGPCWSKDRTQAIGPSTLDSFLKLATVFNFTYNQWLNHYMSFRLTSTESIDIVSKLKTVILLYV